MTCPECGNEGVVECPAHCDGNPDCEICEGEGTINCSCQIRDDE